MGLARLNRLSRLSRLGVASAASDPIGDALRAIVTHHWKFDEASGDILDSVSDAHFTVFNSPGTAAGQVGTSRSFASASSQYGNLAGRSSIYVGDEDFTWAGWAYADDDGSAVCFGNGAFYEIRITPNLLLTLPGFGESSHNTATPIGEWVFWAIRRVFATSTYYFTINDSTVERTNISPAYSSGDIGVGARAGGGVLLFDGRLDETLWIKGTAITDEQLAYCRALGIAGTSLFP